MIISNKVVTTNENCAPGFESYFATKPGMFQVTKGPIRAISIWHVSTWTAGAKCD
jgi:hypothetical protein